MVGVKSLPKKVVMRSISELIPYAKNSRTHSDEQIAQIAASIREFGFTNPVLLDGAKGIVAGHGRVAAARKLGMDSVPCIGLDHLTDTQRRAYILADNKLALNAGWDMDMLGLELGELDGEGFDLSLIGFSDMELGDLLADRTEGLTDPDEAPEVPANPVTALGDLWTCGKHKVLCGDSTVAANVERLLDGITPLLMVTDPPYGVEYDPDWRNRAKRAGSMQAYGASATGVVSNDDKADWREAWALFPGDVAYVWHGALHSSKVAEGLEIGGFNVRAQIVWAKQHAPISRGHYHWQHEPCWYAVRRGGTGHWSGGRKQTTLWQIANSNAFGGQGKSEATGHGAQKPVECMRRPIVNNSAPGQPVYDPFLGSGTTMIAAEMEGRQCLGLELEPAYVDVIVQRWQNFTGEQATLEGKPFNEIAEARYAEAV